MSNSIVVIPSFDDREFIAQLKGMFGDFAVWVVDSKIEMLTHMEMYCAKRQASYVVTTSTVLLEKLVALQGNPKNNPSLSNYAGSMFSYRGIEILFIPPLRQIFTVKYGKFICQRFISKFTRPGEWREPTTFNWSIAGPESFEKLYAEFTGAYAIAVDIETFKVNLAIRCVGYTGIFIDSSTGKISTNSIVIPCDSMYNLAWIRKFNSLPAPKITQRGKYDNSYLLRYNAPLSNWVWDTANLMHCWYSELPKDLAFQNAFFLRKVVYWKDLADTGDLQEYYKYNALDAWATANVWIAQLLQMPDWARRNYILEFPLNYPCLLAELTGIKRDMARLAEARTIVAEQEFKATNSLRRMIGIPDFNPGSSQQVIKLMNVFGIDADTSGEIEVAKALLTHPLTGKVLGLVPESRGFRKLISTYLRLDSDANAKNGWNGASEYKGRILYALNPDGTDSARLASKEHHFWCGLQIQNIPVGEPGEPSHTKTTLCADEGFLLGECDLRQAEAWDLAHIAGEIKLIEVVSGPRDFHSVNASAFFGMSYESLYDDARRKTKNKTIRDLSKRTNHGAGYNMGPPVLVDTMGVDKIWEARKILKLPFYSPESIAEYLLTGYHITYAGIRGPIRIRNDEVREYMGLPECKNKFFAPGTFYASISMEVVLTKRITSRAYHHTEYNLTNYPDRKLYIEQGDWTRYCFGRPDVNKLDLNSYVAHPPQSLNARTLNEAWMRIFYDVALKWPESFRLHAQIHDSVLFSYKATLDEIRMGNESKLPRMVQQCMEISVSVRDVHGIIRTFTVPTDLKIGQKYWSDL